MASTYYDDVDFESFSFDQDPLSPVWTHSDYDNQMSGMDTFWQNMGLHGEQQHQSQVHQPQSQVHQPHAHNPQLLHQHTPQHHIQQQPHTQQQFNVQNQDTDAVIADNFSNHQQQHQHQPQVHQSHAHNGWSNTTNMMYIKQELEQQQHNTQPQQYSYYSNSSSSQNSYDSSFSASTDSDAEFEDSQQSTSWEQPQQHEQHVHNQQQLHYSYPSEHTVNSQTHPEHMYIKPEMKHENTNAYSYDSQGSEDNSWAGEEEAISFMADDENDPVDFKLPASKTPIMEAMVVCAINNWGISVIKSTPGEVIFKVLDFDRYYRISRSICSKHRPTEDIGSRVKSLRRWFTNFPKKKDRQENPQFFLSVKPNTCKKVHGLIERNTKLLNAQRKAR